METDQEKILMVLEKFPMYVSNGKSEIGGRIWDREFSYSRTIEKMTGSEA